METPLDMAYPYVVMRLQGEMHHLEENLREATERLPSLKSQVVMTEEEIAFCKERIMELHAAIAALSD